MIDINTIRVAIANDSIAATFQSLGQYRTWLLRLIDQTRNWEPIEIDGHAGEPQGMEKAP